MIKLSLKLFLAFVLLSSCGQDKKTVSSSVTTDSISVTETKENGSAQVPESTKSKNTKAADAATITARQQVPILCYHQVRDWRAKDSQGAKDYIIPVATFKAHVKMLGFRATNPRS